MNAIKVEISNSVNDDVTREWFFYDTESEKQEWIDDHKKAIDEWNYRTPGAMSCRYSEFFEYKLEDLLKLDMSSFQGLSLKDFLSIIKSESIVKSHEMGHHCCGPYTYSESGKRRWCTDCGKEDIGF